MKKRSAMRKWLLGTLLGLSVVSLVGCGNKATNEVDEPAVKYVTSVASSKWDEVIKQSTGDQLAIYMQLVPSLKQVKQTSDVKKVEVLDRALNDKGDLAFVTVHYIRNVNLPNYGSVMDDRQVLLSMKKLDNQWKVFKMDVVTDLKAKLNQ